MIQQKRITSFGPLLKIFCFTILTHTYVGKQNIPKSSGF